MVQQLSSQQLAGLPAGQSLQPSTLSALNIQLAEASTAHLVSQSLYHLKDYPNPELVSEAVSTGATQDVAASLSDPVLGQYMTATPGSQNPQAPGPDNGPGLPGPNIDSFDWSSYWNNLGQSLSDNPSYRNLGVVPQMNIGWMNGVIGNSDAKATSKWQQWLIDHGTLDKSHAADGTWDDASKAALQSYMIMLAAPEALWAKDDTRRAQASAFLSRLGVDTATLASDVGRNPTTQRDLVLAWMQTQDPQHQGDALRKFSDSFGSDHLTAAEQKIASGGSLWDHVLSGLSTVGGALQEVITAPVHVAQAAASLIAGDPSGAKNQIEAAIPLAGSVLQPRLQYGFGIPGVQLPQDTQSNAIAAQLKQEGLTPQEQAALSPALQQIQNNTGFLPLEWWDQKKSEMLLTTMYALGFSTPGDKPLLDRNPFDALNPNSDLGQRIAAHQDNLASGIFGDEFVKQHQTLTTLTNGIASTLDDPLTYLGGYAMRAPKLAGDLARVLKGAEVVDEAAGLGIQSVLRPSTRQAFDAFLSPKREMERVMAVGLHAVKDSPSTLYKALRITDDTLKHPELAKVIQPALDRIKGARSVDDVRAELHGTFGHVIHTPAFVLNKRDAMQAFSQAVTTAKGESHVLSMRSMGAFRDTGLELNIERPIDAMQTLEQFAKIVGVPDAEITKMMDEWMATDQADRMTWLDTTYVDRVDAAIGKNFPGKSLTQLVEHANSLKKGRSFVVHPQVDEILGPNSRISEVSYRPAQRTGTQVDPKTGQPFAPGAETMKAPRKFPLGTQVWIDQHQAAIDAISDGYKEAVNEYVKRGLKREPAATIDELVTRFQKTSTGKALIAEKDDKVARILAKVNELAPLGTDRAMPASPGQLQQMAMLPATPYEAYVYLNSGVINQWEEIGAHLRADAFYSIWKGLALARPSTALRVMIGDDTTRFLVEMATRGHPLSAMRTFLQASGMGAYAGLGGVATSAVGGAARVLEHGVRRAIPGLVDEPRLGRLLGHTKLGQAAQRISPKAALARADAIDKQLGYHDMFTFAKEMNEVDDTHIRTYDPAEERDHPDIYKRAFRDNFRAIWSNSSSNREWAQVRYGMKNELTAKYGSGDSAALKYLTDVYAGKQATADSAGVAHITAQAKRNAETLAAEQHDWLKAITSDRELLRWGANGKIGKAFDQHFKQHQALYPIVAAPRQTVFTHNFLLRALRNGPQSMFRAVAEPMIHVSRSEGAWQLKLMYEKHIAQVHPDWSSEQIGALASDQAIHWMQDNLYNGQRTLLGRSLRHVFPFDGAVGNMARFYVRQLRMHPYLAEPLTRFAFYEEQQAANNQDTSLLVNNNILSALGFSGSDALTGNLSHSFFLTADGLASFIPGVGPMFTPLLSYVANDQNLRDMFSGIPGLREQLQYAVGRSTGANPLQSAVSDVLPSWFSDQVDAVGLISPLHSPLLSGLTGTGEDYMRRYDLKAKQLYADYLSGKRDAPPTTSDVQSSVGADLLGAGVVGDILPISPKIVDERSKQATNFSNQMQAATTDAQRKTVYDAAMAEGKRTGFDVTPLLLYWDPKTTLDEQDKLVNDNQWIAPYVTSMYEAKGPKPSTLSEYDAAIAKGDLHALGVGEMLPQISDKVQHAWLWVKYQQVRNAQATFLQANGVTTSSPEYKAYLASTINPAIQQLEQLGESSGWTQSFLKSTSTTVPGLTANTVPLRTVSTWDVLPITQDLENGKTIAWRKAKINMDEASSALATIRAEGGSRADEQAIIDGLNTQLQGIAAQSPDFATELQRYGFTKFEDIVNLQMQEDVAGYGTG